MKIFKYLKRTIEKIKTEKGERLFLDINFNKRDNSFLVTPNYKAIHYSTKILLNKKFFPVGEFVRFIPHYSLHSPEGIFIASGKGIQRFNINGARITTLDIVPTIFYFLGVKHKDSDMKGRVILKEVG